MKIANVRVFLTQPCGPHRRLIVVRVETSEPGLYGLGCATFTQRHRAVEAAVRHHLGPRVTGRDPRNIEDLWQEMMVSGYWRNGPVLNNAISGIDMALWDIAGKRAGLPCHDLWGGRCRPAVPVYLHADGATKEEVADRARALMEEGVRHVRCQIGGYSGVGARRAGLGPAPARREMTPAVSTGGPDAPAPGGAAFAGVYFDPREKLREVPRLFAHLRAALGDEVELLYDVHERLEPIEAVALAKALEPYRLFFLEDVVAPEDLEWLAMLRAQTCTPIAIGELFNHPHEMTPFIQRRLLDFIRVHVSQIGGVTPAIKLAHLCAAFGVRTAWHGPGDVSPVGMAANVHLDLALHNFGIQEWGVRAEVEYEMFPGLPELRGGCVDANGRPGWGIEFREDVAARYPCDDEEPEWTRARRPDGTVSRP